MAKLHLLLDNGEKRTTKKRIIPKAQPELNVPNSPPRHHHRAYIMEFPHRPSGPLSL